MRILVVGSCGKKKLTQHPDAPSCSDLAINSDLSEWKSKFSNLVFPAGKMYTGYQNRELAAATDGLRAVKGVEVDMYIISAGFGMLKETTLIPPYECSFNNMNKAEILERAEYLGIREAFRGICGRNYDLLYLALSKKYMLALDGQYLHEIESTTVVFHGKNRGFGTVYVPSGSTAVRSFSQQGFKIHGVVGFKGDLLRILMEYAWKMKNPYSELHSWKNPLKLKMLIYKLGGLEYEIISE